MHAAHHNFFTSRDIRPTMRSLGVLLALLLGGSRVHADAIDDKGREMWALQPLRQPQPPQVQHGEWCANPIDAFIIARLQGAGLSPAPPADKITLIRRATYDLTGLAPTLAEVQAFVEDNRPDAYEWVVDRLLASPHYGEQWGRHWLDLVRYAESNSYERDSFKPNVWRYRDYVIRAFNSDKPYDRFIREQIAGDELPDGGRDGIYATGYYHLGIWDDEPSDGEQARFDVLDDVVSTTGQTFLGLTVGCALPQSQDRSVPAKGLLQAPRIFSKHCPLRQRRRQLPEVTGRKR